MNYERAVDKNIADDALLAAAHAATTSRFLHEGRTILERAIDAERSVDSSFRQSGIENFEIRCREQQAALVDVVSKTAVWIRAFDLQRAPVHDPLLCVLSTTSVAVFVCTACATNEKRARVFELDHFRQLIDCKRIIYLIMYDLRDLVLLQICARTHHLC